MLSIVGFGICLRIALLVVAALVLGLSVTLASHQVVGVVPSPTGYGTFLGAVGFFASVFGLAGLWLDNIDEKILMTLDTVVSLLYLGGATFLTTAMSGVSSCTATDSTSIYNRVTSDILSGGCDITEGGMLCLHAVSPDGRDLTPARCLTALADITFEYVGFVFAMIMVCLGHVLSRRGGGGPPTATWPRQASNTTWGGRTM
ncbi:hypothetical protein F4802DRAFT_289422 [Xylaria palmicola]|nr:hypothetical protein F4802DRAFT_289422 [Xylaria palmicola]